MWGGEVKMVILLVLEAAAELQTQTGGERIPGASREEDYILLPPAGHQYPSPTTTPHAPPPGNENEGQTMMPGYVAAVVTISLVFAGIIFIMVFSSWRPSRSKKKRTRLTFHDQIEQEFRAFIEEDDEEYENKDNIILEEVEEEPTLWEAVLEGKTEVVEELLDGGLHQPDVVEKGRHTTPVMDAHLAGNKDVLRVFTRHKKEAPSLPTDDVIKSVLHELETALKAVFVAAECGMYTHEQGVRALLEQHQLPGTVRDRRGRSLLHCMASISAMDGQPSWQPQHMKEFFANHEHYVNAVDHCGRTALHELSQHPRTADVQDIIWDGKEWVLADAWLAVAGILTSYGCDPRIPDHQGRLPHQLAREAHNHELASFLEEKCRELGEVDVEQAVGQQEEVVLAAQQGDTTYLRELIDGGVPLLPAGGARTHPLLEAIRHSQRGAVMLLLCAGAPLCSPSSEGITPLETAHTTRGLPAVFPALMRKACCEHLEDELLKVPDDDGSLSDLRQGISDYILLVTDVGSKAKWIFKKRDPSERVREARRLLTQASELGLSVTCQVLGLEDVYLQSLPGEERPFQRAVSHRNIDTQHVLYRDLKLIPFTCDSLCLEAWPLRQLGYHWLSEYQLLENLCSSESDEDVMTSMQTTLKEMKEFMNNHLAEQDQTGIQKPNDKFLYLVSKHGLVILLHTLVNKCASLHINQVVERCSACTMLHVSAIHGQMNVTEYLLHCGADIELLTVGGFTAAHLAALAGQRKSFEYILASMSNKGITMKTKCLIGLSPSELMVKYDELCRNCKLPLLAYEDALCIRNEAGEDVQACELLRKKGKILNINLPEDLLRIACKEADSDKPSVQKCLRKLEEETVNLCKQITDPRYQGKLSLVGSPVKGNDGLNFTDVSFIYEVSVREASPGGADVVCREVVTNDRRTVVPELIPLDPHLSTADNFKQSFAHLVKKLVRTHEPLASDISLAPPFVLTTSSGVYLHWIWNTGGKIRLLRSHIAPVLPAVLSSDDCVDGSSSDPGWARGSEGSPRLHVVNVDNEWLCRPYIYERDTFTTLGSNQRKVWLACHFVNQLLHKCWWSPEVSSGGHCTPWHTLSLGFEGLPERALKALFLREMAESEEWNSSQQMFERVASVYEQATQRDMRGKRVPQDKINSSLPPQHYCSGVSVSVCGILLYLDELREAQAALDKTPKVKFVSIS